MPHSPSPTTVARVKSLTAPPGLVVAGVEQRLSGLTAGEARTARVLLGLGPDLVYRSVTEVAAQAGCSISSVVRCCQRLGFKGFQDLKIALSRDADRPTKAILDELHDDDTPQAVLHKVAAAGAEAITSGVRAVDAAQFERAVALLSNAARVLVVGVGTSAPLAQDAAYRLLTLGVPAEAPADVHVQHVRARLLDREGVCLVVSHTGSTREPLAAVAAARQVGARVVAVSSFPRSPLAEVADVLLVAGSRETTYRVEAMASRIAHLVVLDALCVAIARRTEERASAALQATADVLAEHRF